jgi:hypothetical protein
MAGNVCVCVLAVKENEIIRLHQVEFIEKY